MSNDSELVQLMALAIRDNLELTDCMVVYRALTERPERLSVLLKPYGGSEVSGREFASIMLRMSKVALSAGGPS